MVYIKLIVYHNHDVVSGSDITLCIKIDKPLVVIILSNLCNDVNKNIAYIMTESEHFHVKMRL